MIIGRISEAEAMLIIGGMNDLSVEWRRRRSSWSADAGIDECRSHDRGIEYCKITQVFEHVFLREVISWWLCPWFYQLIIIVCSVHRWVFQTSTGTLVTSPAHTMLRYITGPNIPTSWNSLCGTRVGPDLSINLRRYVPLQRSLI